MNLRILCKPSPLRPEVLILKNIFLDALKYSFDTGINSYKDAIDLIIKNKTGGKYDAAFYFEQCRVLRFDLSAYVDFYDYIMYFKEMRLSGEDIPETCQRIGYSYLNFLDNCALFDVTIRRKQQSQLFNQEMTERLDEPIPDFQDIKNWNW